MKIRKIVIGARDSCGRARCLTLLAAATFEVAAFAVVALSWVYPFH